MCRACVSQCVGEFQIIMSSRCARTVSATTPVGPICTNREIRGCLFRRQCLPVHETAKLKPQLNAEGDITCLCCAKTSRVCPMNAHNA
jgi:hypothetical protein